ncbi:MAG: pyridoxal phosphate-dependent aminotransferase [Bacteroidia bacterium]|nr:pyridoxal phosphate-dependent aminotransferase [Bacteroidia bacterium]
MAKLGRALGAEGKKVISLSFGEPDFFTPDHIKEAAIAAINNNNTFYTPVAGIPELREAISLKFKRDNNLDYKTDQIVVSTGAKNSIMNTVLALVNPGDEVIIPKPFWVSYEDMVSLAEGIPVYIDTDVEADYKITPQQLEDAITPKTKMFIFSSPNNPTGSVYTKTELEGLAAVFEKYPYVYIVSDEIYEHINFVGKHESIAACGNVYPQVITVNGVSKGFSMTGWRIGYIGAAKEIAFACEKLQSQFTSGTNSIAQRAAVAALTGTLEPTEKMRLAFMKRRDLCLSLMKDMDGIKLNNPDGAFYLFPDVSSFFGKSADGKTINNSQDLCMYLLNKVYVVTVAGSAFGNENCIRMSYATNEENLREAITRIKSALSELK